MPSTDVVVARLDAHPVQPVGERLVDDLVHERRLARARDAGDADELADREVDVDVLQVVHPTRRGRRTLPRSSARRSGIAISRLPERNCPVTDFAFRSTCLRRALGDDVPAVHAGARAHVDQVVGRAHHLLVVLDHEHRVAEVAQPLERADQLAVVALVEADRRLVEDVEHADELGADLRREPEPLRLAAGERRGGAVELQVADADVLEEGQPLADLLQDPRADQLLGLGQLEPVDELDRPLHRHARELVDVLAADGDGEHLGLQARAVADRAGPEAHVLLDPLALLARVGLPVAALEARDDALEGEHVRALAAHPVAVLDVDLVAVGAEQEEVLLLLGEVLPRRLEVDLVAVGDRLDDRLVEARVAERPGHERALADRERRVGHEQVGVDLLLRAEAGAARAGAVRRVEARRCAARAPGARRRARGRRSSREKVSSTRRRARRRRRGRRRAAAAVSTDWASRVRRSGFITSRSTTTSIVCLNFLSSVDRLLEQVLLAVDLHAREALLRAAPRRRPCTRPCGRGRPAR